MKRLTMWCGPWDVYLYSVGCGIHVGLVWPVECVHLGLFTQCICDKMQTVKCYLTSSLALRHCFLLASWVSLPLSPEGVRMPLPYPDFLFKRHSLPKKCWFSERPSEATCLASCVPRVPWGYLTPKAVGSDPPGGLVGTLSAWKCSVSNSGHYQLGQSDPYVVKPWHLLIQSWQSYSPGDVSFFSPRSFSWHFFVYFF